MNVWCYHATHENRQGAGSKISLAHLPCGALLVFLVLWSSRKPGRSSMCGWRQKVHAFLLCKTTGPSEWWQKSPEDQVLKHKQVPAHFTPTNKAAVFIALMQGELKGLQPHQNTTNMSIIFLYCCVSTVTCRGIKINWIFKRTTWSR